jgi:hypothetical protein
MTAQTILKYTVDLNKGLQMTPLAPMLATEDDNAHSFVVSAVRDGEKVSFAGAQVRGYFIRPDQVTVPLDGEVDEKGNALVTLKEACYRVQGKFQIAIRVISDDVKAVVFCGDGSIRKTSTDAVVDEAGIIPSLDELLAQIATIEGAVNNAAAAADRANAAAEKAENAKGDTGATPNLTIGSVETLDAGSNATATITGTPEDPVLSLGIPKGYDGVGAVLSVNGKTGEVVLNAADVGAAPAIEDPSHPGCYYRMVDGVQEWINPPMAVGVEYRTAERFGGRIVYVKNFNTGSLTNGGTFDYTSENVEPVRSIGRMGSYLLPSYEDGALKGGVWCIWHQVTGKTFKAGMGSGHSSLPFNSTVWYVKV